MDSRSLFIIVLMLLLAFYTINVFSAISRDSTQKIKETETLGVQWWDRI